MCVARNVSVINECYNIEKVKESVCNNIENFKEQHQGEAGRQSIERVRKHPDLILDVRENKRECVLQRRECNRTAPRRG